MKLYRTAFAAIVTVSASCLTANAGATVSIVDSIMASGNIIIDQPEALTRLLVYRGVPVMGENAEASETAHAHPAVRTGYRVQVFDDNNPRSARRNAEAAEQRIAAQFPHLRSYMTFNSPYWRVKVGDFRSRAEAEAVMAEIRQAFPSLAAYLRVVRDKINID